MPDSSSLPDYYSEIGISLPLSPSERRDLERLNEFVEYAGRLYGQINGMLGPEDGSLLGKARDIGAKLRPFDKIKRHLLVACLNIDALRYFIGTDHAREARFDLPLVGYYSVIRSSIECSALALWTLEAKNERALLQRTLKVDHENIYRGSQAVAATIEGSVNPDHRDQWSDTAERSIEVLRPIAKAAGIPDSAWVDKNPPNYSDLLANLQSHHPIHQARSFSPTAQPVPLFAGSWLATWQLCSGVAHGKSWPDGTVYDTDSQEHPDGSGVRLEQSPRIAPITACAGVSATLLSIAMESLTRQAGIADGPGRFNGINILA